MDFCPLFVLIYQIISYKHTKNKCFSFQNNSKLKKRKKAPKSLNIHNGAPIGIRTPNLLVRSQTLYPIELWAHFPKRYKYYIPIFEKIQVFYKSNLISLPICSICLYCTPQVSNNLLDAITLSVLAYLSDK